MTLTDTSLDSFVRDGYVHGGRLLSDAEVQEFRAELDRVIAQHDRGHVEQVYIGETAAFCQRRDCFLQVTNIRELSGPFADLAARPALVALAARLLGTPELRLFADAILYKSGKNPGVNDWHQDGPAFDILARPEVLTAWIALDDVGENDGSVCFARGSHTWGLPPAQARPRLDEMARTAAARGFSADGPLQRCLLARGDVHFHHALTWHCSLANSSGRPRRGFVVNFIPAAVPFNARGVHYLKHFVEVGDAQPIAGHHFPVVSVTER